VPILRETCFPSKEAFKICVYVRVESLRQQLLYQAGNSSTVILYGNEGRTAAQTSAGFALRPKHQIRKKCSIQIQAARPAVHCVAENTVQRAWVNQLDFIESILALSRRFRFRTSSQQQFSRIWGRAFSDETVHNSPADSSNAAAGIHLRTHRWCLKRGKISVFIAPRLAR